MNDLGAALYYTDPESNLELMQESLRRALTANLPHAVCRGYANTATMLRFLDRYAEARDAFEACMLYAERLQMSDYARLFPRRRFIWNGCTVTGRRGSGI